MGPRPFGRGRHDEPEPLSMAIWTLQWGRDLSVAEGSRSIAAREDGESLQWGRDLSVAEGCGTAPFREPES